jgi:hypothetical protein
MAFQVADLVVRKAPAEINMNMEVVPRFSSAQNLKQPATEVAKIIAGRCPCRKALMHLLAPF